MKAPEITECPSCGMKLSTSPAHPYSHTAIPQTYHQHSVANGKMTRGQLYWMCKACGCKWMHGQYRPARPNVCPARGHE